MPESGSNFKDHFSGHASEYSRYRPGYPVSLFTMLSALVPSHRLAWDCATGNGQAARGLAPHFDRVIATDASAEQIANAPASNGIEYRLASAECSGLDDESVDLVTVAQALHWFDLDAFFAEAGRVLRAGGVLAFWTYRALRIDAAVEAVVRHYYRDVVGSYWPPERRMVERGYRDIVCPFPELELTAQSITMNWDRDALCGYLRTWSATQRYMAQTGDDPLPAFEARLAIAWPRREEIREVRWPLAVRACRKPG